MDFIQYLKQDMALCFKQLVLQTWQFFGENLYHRLLSHKDPIPKKYYLSWEQTVQLTKTSYQLDLYNCIYQCFEYSKPCNRPETQGDKVNFQA